MEVPILHVLFLVFSSIIIIMINGGLQETCLRPTFSSLLTILFFCKLSSRERFIMNHVPSTLSSVPRILFFSSGVGYIIFHMPPTFFLSVPPILFSTSLQFIMLCTGVCLGQCVSSIPCEIEIK